ncbi:MAG: DUF5597 domain-containing protein [Bacteroidales bacterium]
MSKRLVFLLIALFSGVILFSQDKPHLPFFKEKNGIKQLILNNEPFIMLSGELHNSSASNAAYMEPIWDKLAAMHLNTVIATVSWELFEPAEGKFDYTLVDGIIKSAREHQLKLVLIWFGTWKNSWSTYAPEWVKTDLKRFPRMQIKQGENSGALSAFGENTMKADISAFIALMKHIKEIDENEQTVIMMQVENETGVLNTSRDYSVIADSKFKSKVPEELIKYLKLNKNSLIPQMKTILASTNKLSGTWEEIFGQSADEVFQAWYTATYVGKVASAGRIAYNIPMYANAWLDPNFSEMTKTDYPSGGPVIKMLDIWRAAAPSIDLLAPDIYLEDFKRVCKDYVQSGNTLFIPEAQRDARAAANVYYAIGQHNAVGFSPFGIDGIRDITNISEVYGSLSSFLPFFVQHQGTVKNIGILFTGIEEETYNLGGFKIKIKYLQKRNTETNTPEAAGLILNTAPGEFYIAGFGFRLYFESNEDKSWVEYLSHEEGKFENGIWKPGRRMNGDELEVEMLSKPSIHKVKVHIIK